MHPKCEKGAKAEAKGRQGEAKGEGRKGVEKQVLKSVQEAPGSRGGGGSPDLKGGTARLTTTPLGMRLGGCAGLLL